MRQRRFYTLGFLLVFLAALAGARLTRQFVGPVEPPQLIALTDVQAFIKGLDLNSLIRLPASANVAGEADAAAASSEPVALVETQPAPALLEPPPTPSGAVEAPAEAAATPEPVTPVKATETPERPTPTLAPPTPTPTAAPTQPADSGFPFVAAGPVRHSEGDCPGPSIRGLLRDAAGNALPNVRVWRYDQWGNEQTVVSKSGQADLGQYDFPLGDTPNVHYVQVVDASGVALSPPVEVQHRQGDAPEAVCHWLDWTRR